MNTQNFMRPRRVRSSSKTRSY